MQNSKFSTILALLIVGTLVLSACSETLTEPISEPLAEMAAPMGNMPTSSMYVAGQQAAAPAAAQPNAFPCQRGERILVIQDNVPWYDPGYSHSMGANVEELIQQQMRFCVINSSQIGTTNLGRYGMIVISAAQSQTFYNNLFPGGVVHPDVTAFVRGGGRLSAFLTDRASGPGSGGSWGGDSFVGGLRYVGVSSSNNNIVAPWHSIIKDSRPCPGSNCARIIDDGTYNDLDDWSSSSHGYFTNLPGHTTVILDNGSGRPVMVEYPFGQGKVIATMTTTEWRYVGSFGSARPQNKKLTANDIAYQYGRRFNGRR